MPCNFLQKENGRDWTHQNKEVWWSLWNDWDKTRTFPLLPFPIHSAWIASLRHCRPWSRIILDPDYLNTIGVGNREELGKTRIPQDGLRARMLKLLRVRVVTTGNVLRNWSQSPLVRERPSTMWVFCFWFPSCGSLSFALLTFTSQIHVHGGVLQNPSRRPTSYIYRWTCLHHVWTLFISNSVFQFCVHLLRTLPCPVWTEP